LFVYTKDHVPWVAEACRVQAYSCSSSYSTAPLARVLVGSATLRVSPLFSAFRRLVYTSSVAVRTNAGGVPELILEGKYSLGSTDPRESEIRAHLRP